MLKCDKCDFTSHSENGIRIHKEWKHSYKQRAKRLAAALAARRAMASGTPKKHPAFETPHAHHVVGQHCPACGTNPMAVRETLSKILGLAQELIK